MTGTRRKHILTEFDAELEALREQLGAMGAVLQRQVTDAIAAFTRAQRALARRVVEGDQQVDDLERSIDQRCISLLALRQPEASDLRFIAATLKIVTDLERVGDLAVDSAAQTGEVVPRAALLAMGQLEGSAQLALELVQSALHAFVDGDVAAAANVRTREASVATSLSRPLGELRAAMREDPELLEPGLAILSVAKHVERMAAHASNVAEMVIYFARGEDVRHAKA